MLGWYYNLCHPTLSFSLKPPRQKAGKHECQERNGRGARAISFSISLTRLAYALSETFMGITFLMMDTLSPTQSLYLLDLVF